MKRRLYIFMPVFLAVLLLSSAALCSLGDLVSDMASDPGKMIEGMQAGDGDPDSGAASSGGDNSSSGSSGNDGQASGSSSSSSADSNDPDNSGANNSNDDQKKSNSPPVINSITFSSDVFLPGQQYAMACDVYDPDNDPIFYDWSVDGGFTDNPEASSPVWNTPDQEGVYVIELTISDGWGGYDTETVMVSVGAVARNASPVINFIAVYPDGAKYTNNTYEIFCDVSDPNNSLISYDFRVTGGSLHSQDANIIKWDTPPDAGTYTITVSVSDKEGNVVNGSQDVNIEAQWTGVSDIEVHHSGVISTNASYNVEATVVDPGGEINSFSWNAAGGQFAGQNGRHVTWETPDTPGTYTLTLTVSTFSGDSYSLSKDFTVVSP